MRPLVATAIVLFASLLAFPAMGTPPPKKGATFPKGYLDRLDRDPSAFTTRRGLRPFVETVRANRDAYRQKQITLAAARTRGGVDVNGTRAIPVLMGKYSNTTSEPIAATELEKELFTGPWPTGTMKQYYEEISYGLFSVTGTVFPWKKVSKKDTHYEGPGDCKGLCDASKVGDFLQEVLDANDGEVDFSDFDNDGPDKLANSGDDDGYVDFAAFVHPEAGGECSDETIAIWSHRWSYSNLKGTDYTTNDQRHGGGFIKIDDYVIQPALACDGVTMIQIGVFAHEFGHAFGLPDLYDTDDENGKSAGVGEWCLMGAGSWGGDGNSPERPSHMSIWAKEYLGWVKPEEVTVDLPDTKIVAIEKARAGYRLSISQNQHYLVEMRAKTKFDQNLPASGLLVWKVNDAVIRSGMANNRVNADEHNPGLEVVEADDNGDLDNNRSADAGDVFPGDEAVQRFDNGSNPSSLGKTAVCSVSLEGENARATLKVSDGNCGTETGGGGNDVGGCASMADRSKAGSGWGVLASLGVIPFTVGVISAIRRGGS